jgi:hypothetical protein
MILFFKLALALLLLMQTILMVLNMILLLFMMQRLLLSATTIAAQSSLSVVDEDVAAVTAEMRDLESQFHPGYALAGHCAYIEYFPDSADAMPDLYWPGDSDIPCSADNIGVEVACISLPSLTSSTRVIIDSSFVDVGDVVTGNVVEGASRLDTVVDGNRSDPGRFTWLLASSRSARLPDPRRSVRLPEIPIVDTSLDFQCFDVAAVFHPDPAPHFYANIANIDAADVIDESIPRVPVAPVPGKEILPQGNGPGDASLRTISYEPTHLPHHGE